MIVEVEQFRALREQFARATADLSGGPMRHGVMLEVPAACLRAEEILTVADFASIGTNDLYQYLYAVDRNNELVARDFRPDRPALWSLVGGVVRAARRLRKPLSVCGEIAGWPAYVATLMRLGVGSVSVSPRVITEVRRAARRERPGKGEGRP
jgi:phosphotransferase system enzyme I (PtsI)